MAINNGMKVLQTSDNKHCNIFGPFHFDIQFGGGKLIPYPNQIQNPSAGSGHTAQQQQQSGEYFPRISSGQPACPATGLPVSPALCHCTLGHCGQRSSSSYIADHYVWVEILALPAGQLTGITAVQQAACDRLAWPWQDTSTQVTGLPSIVVWGQK